MSTRLVRKSLKPLATSFLVVATTRLGAIGAKQTAKCFTSSRWGEGASKHFRCQFPVIQHRVTACDIATLAPSHPWTFAEAAAAVLGVNAGVESDNLDELLIKHGKTLTLTQLEKMVEGTKATGSGRSANMRVNGHLNFAFVETEEEYHPVMVMSVHRLISKRWNTQTFLLDNYEYRNADDRILVCNLALKR